MKTNDRIRFFLIVIGALLIIISLTLFTADKIRLRKDSERGRSAVELLNEAMPESTPGIIHEDRHSDMPILEFDGVDICGKMNIPAHNQEIAVAAKWDKKHAGTMLSVYSGTVYDGTLVVGGTIDCISELDKSEDISFTTMRGEEFSYNIDEIRHSESVGNDKLIVADSDLTVFSRSALTDDYIIVYCKRLG